MNILVINAGSSSLKYQLINMDDQSVISKGICERIGSPESFHKHGLNNEVYLENPLPDHQAAINQVLEQLTGGDAPAVSSLEEIGAVGHRVVQGGSNFTESTLIDEDAIAKIDEFTELAPLHNGPNILGIRACQQAMPGVPMVAVLDTSFHQTMPAKAYMYPIPYEYYEKYAVRKYGFHGTSHRYVANRAAELVGKPIEDLKIITCHIGNGASIAAVDGGKVIDTSMGLTPLDGLMMGTRCGSIDPAIVPFIMEHENMTTADANNMLNKKSGLLGISGVSNDMRSVEEAADEGNERAKLSLEMFAYIAKKVVGSYLAALGGCDVLVFTAGVGENSASMRAAILEGMEGLGFKIDPALNDRRGFEGPISTDDSAVKILVIPTNEELAIAKDTYEIVSNLA